MHVMMDTCQWQIQVSNVYMSVMARCQWQKHATDRCMGVYVVSEGCVCSCSIGMTVYQQSCGSML